MSANTSTAVIARIRGWAEANSWSKTKFAAEAGLVDTTLRHFHQEDWNPTRETLAALEAVIPAGWQAGDAPPPPPARPRRRSDARQGEAA